MFTQTEASKEVGSKMHSIETFPQLVSKAMCQQYESLKRFGRAWRNCELSHKAATTYLFATSLTKESSVLGSVFVCGTTTLRLRYVFVECSYFMLEITH